MKEKGFTLLEIIIAMLILSIGLLSILELTTLSTQNINKVKTLNLAVHLAHSKMVEIEKGIERNTEGDFGQKYKGFKWEVDFYPIQDSPLQIASLKVSWKGRQKERKLELKTLMLLGEN
jgi:type II secretion system protein I